MRTTVIFDLGRVLIDLDLCHCFVNYSPTIKREWSASLARYAQAPGTSNRMLVEVWRKPRHF